MELIQRGYVISPGVVRQPRSRETAQTAAGFSAGKAGAAAKGGRGDEGLDESALEGVVINSNSGRREGQAKRGLTTRKMRCQI